MIKVLFLAANPAGTSQLALDEEIRAIDAKIRGAEHRDRLTMVSHWAVRLDDLSGLLMRERPAIVHFSGHGAASGAIVLVGADGTPKTVPPEALAGMFRVLKDNVRVVVLNACYSGAQAKAIVKEIDCAIGMRGSSQSGAQSIVYELDTLRHKARHGLEQLSLVILSSCANKSQTTTAEQCQVAAGSIWDGPRA